MSTTVFVGSTEFSTSKVFNIYFKKKLNQVGNFEFYIQSKALTGAEQSLIVPNRIIQIIIDGTTRFEGFISKVTKNKFESTWRVEGQSLEGILSTRSTRTPVTIRGGVGQQTITGKDLIQQLVFRFGGFATTGDTGWSIIGGEGIDTWFYKIESRTIADHVSNISRISGYDWRAYLSSE